MAINVTGPTTRDASTVALGLAKVLVGPAATHVSDTGQVLDRTTDSLGALNSTEFTSEVEYWKLTSGFPAMEDKTIPLSEVASFACEFKEIHAKNLAYARGIDASTGYADNQSGEIGLGNMSAPSYVRMESIYTYPDGDHEMVIVFPRSNVTSSVNLSFATDNNANVPITIEAKRADSGVSGGDAAWDSMPLGRIFWQATV